MRSILLCSAVAVAVPLAAPAQVVAPAVPLPSQTAQGDVAVTIYNNNRALVEDKRMLDLPAGRSRQEFRDVSAQIEPATVTLNGRGIGIVEQNFDFDLLSPTALMQKAVGQTVTIVRTNPGTGAETRERARILAVNGGVVMQIGDRIEVLRDDGIPARVIFDRVPETLSPRPTLSVTVNADGGGRRPVTLTYLTPGLAWAADYVALFDEANGRMDVQGWITLTNNSGTPYVNASTLLVAGAVGNAGGGYDRYGRGYPPPPPPPPPPEYDGPRRPGTETAPRERLGDFYLYPLPERTTIADKQTKQVGFLDVQSAPATRGYEFQNGWLSTAEQAMSVNSVLRFSSSRQAGLGDALPAGTVRVYQRDARGNPQFVGEHRIGHTPMGSDIGLATGQAFDIKVRPIVEERTRVNDDRWRTRMRYELTNASPKAVTVDLFQAGLWGDTRIVAQSAQSQRTSADEARWRVTVPANGRATLTATFDTATKPVRVFATLIGLCLAAGANAQALAQSIVTSAAPDRVAVTVYRNPDRGLEPLNLQWLGGYALVSETRRVSIPAGESELRFEGVTSGIVPQSAIVTGLGEAVIEKNRDARLLSPGSLLDASLGERLTLRRTSRATGQVRTQDAIVRATADGVILQTEAGFEALRCNGMSETLLAPSVPPGLSAKPTLSVRVRSPRPVQREVTLSYITNNFDWQADYVGDLSADGRTLSLFAWLTLANGDDTGLANANTHAVAGKLNRERVWVERGEAKPITLNCWPSGTTSDIPEESKMQQFSAEAITVTGSRVMAPPPPPPPPQPERGGDDVMAQEERLGDVRLYRVPIAVTVAARSQKQIAMIKQPAVKFESVLRLRAPGGRFDTPLERVLVTRNRKAEGLGLPLPAGKLALFGTRQGRRVLLGEGSIDDHTIGEKVEIRIATASGVRASQVPAGETDGERLLTLTNDMPSVQTVEIELPLEARARGLVKRDGWMIWRVRVPANGRSQLRYSIAT